LDGRSREEEQEFSGAVAKLPKATISLVMSVGQSAWNNSASPWTDFDKILYFFLKSVEKIQVS
jgi:hypothetical protein